MPNETDPTAQVVAFIKEKLPNASVRMALAKLVSDVPADDLVNLAVAIAESTPNGTEVPVITGDSLARRFPHAARIGILGPGGDRRTA